MMNSFLFVSLMFFCLFGSAHEKRFTIRGTLPPTEKNYIITLRWNSGERVKEVKVTNGKFVIDGTTDEPIRALLRISEENPPKDENITITSLSQNSLELFLDEGVITVTTKTNLSLSEVKGTEIVNDFQSFNIKTRTANELLTKIYELKSTYNSKSESAKVLNEMISRHSDLIFFEEMAFVKKYPSSPVSLYFVKKALGYDMNIVKAGPMFSLLSDTLLKTESGKKIQNLIDLAKKTMIGAKAVDFIQPDLNGSDVRLSSFKGKYVLIDFWASWCVPCRAEAPTLRNVYSRYAGKSFEIIAVTLDEDKDKWVKAIQEDQYSWPQLGDLKGWDNAVAREYGVNGVPFNLLLDPNGVIIARNLRGEELEKKLAQILN